MSQKTMTYAMKISNHASGTFEVMSVTINVDTICIYIISSKKMMILTTTCNILSITSSKIFHLN
jgi:hypothetical protein